MIRNPYYLNDQAAAAREEEIEKLYNTPSIKALLKQMGKDKAFLAANSSRFRSYLAALKTCQGCKGLEFCQQNLPGRVKQLYLDNTGYLNDRYTACKYTRQKDQSLAHQSMYKIRHMSDEDLLLDASSIAMADESKSYVDALLAVIRSLGEHKGVYLYGEPGTGKSYIMKCAANRVAKDGTKVSFVNVSMLMSDLKNHMRDDDYKTRMFNILCNSPVLILDDLGSEQVSAWTRDSVLFPLLDYRMNHRQKTYFTSNYSLSDLQDLYTLKPSPAERVAVVRLLDRIKTLTNPVILTGQSRRY